MAQTPQEILRLQNEFRAQQADIERQIAEATARADQQARSLFDASLATTTNRLLQQNAPAIDQYRNLISQIQQFREGKINRVQIQTPDGGGGEVWERENFAPGPATDQLIDRYLTGFQNEINNLQNPQLLRQQAINQIAEQSSYGPYGGVNTLSWQLTGNPIPTQDAYAKIEDLLRQESYQTAKPQAEAFFVQPLLGRFENLQEDYNQRIENAYQQFETQAQAALKNPEVQMPQLVTTPEVPSPVTTPPVATPPAAPTVVSSTTAPPLAAPITTETPLSAPLQAAPVTQATPPLAQQVAAQPQNVPSVSLPQTSFLGGIPTGIGGQAQSTGIPTMATIPSLTPENLPALRSAGGGGTSAIDPTLRPYLELGLRAAEQQFLQNVPQFFPGQTYVSPSQQTLDALAAQEQIARQAPATLQAAQESYMRGLGGLGATASGAFLAGNPFQQQMIQAATRPIMQQFEEQTLPGIASGFSGAGRYGSGAMERALGRATESTARAIGDVSTNIAFQDYGAERGRQQQAILGQITAAGQAPQIYGQQFLPSQQLAQIGAAREAIAGLPLQEQMQRFQFAQQAPRESLSAFLSSVYGTPMARSQYAPTPEAQTNRAASALGLGAIGAGIGSMIGGQTGAFGYTTPQLTAGGAALGALGGLLL